MEVSSDLDASASVPLSTGEESYIPPTSHSRTESLTSQVVARKGQVATVMGNTDTVTFEYLSFVFTKSPPRRSGG